MIEPTEGQRGLTPSQAEEIASGLMAVFEVVNPGALAARPELRQRIERAIDTLEVAGGSGTPGVDHFVMWMAYIEAMSDDE